jgi:hypothetical protein
MRASVCLLLAFFVLAGPAAGNDDIVTAGADLSVDASPTDGRLVIDLAGDLWLLPPAGGQAERLLTADVPLRRPRWSPSGDRILYQAAGQEGTSIWLTPVATPSPTRVSDGGIHSQDASWHPDGDRIVFSSDRHRSGLDIWETDLATGLSWRLTHGAGDESEPVWSANGRHLAWIEKTDAGYALMLRRRGEPDVAVVESADRLSAPAWRTDGSLLTFLRHGPGGPTLEMAILSDPVLLRVIEQGEDIISAPVSWRDRHTMYYTADGLVRYRGFEDRRSRPVHFRAFITPAQGPPPAPVVQRELDVVDAPSGRLIVRAARLFDGLWPGYRTGHDVVIDGGRITAVEPQRARDDGAVLDLGDVTIMPGLVDAWSALGPSLASGSAILAYGVTTLVTDDDRPAFDPRAWEGEQTPGPRVLRIDDAGRASATLSIADSGVEAIRSLIDSRQAQYFGHAEMPPRRFATPPALQGVAGTVVVGSKPNRMAPGIGLHAELLALTEAGLSGEQALHAAGRNAARALGLEFQLGTLTPGAVADLVLVRGDPLTRISDSLNVVAVVRNGRFFSMISLLERTGNAANVE